MPSEIVKHNYLKSFSYNHGLFIFYFLPKQLFIITLIEYNFLHLLFCTLRCSLIFQYLSPPQPGNFHNIWRHSFREILQFCYSVYFCNNMCMCFQNNNITMWTFVINETWVTVSMNALVMWHWMKYCDWTFDRTFDTFWFPFYCDSEHVMKLERVLGQFLVRSNEQPLQNISKDCFHI